MKQTRLVKMLAAGMACAVAVGIALAQETTTTTVDPVTGTTTTTTGTIAAYTPDSDYFTFRTAVDAAPVRYYYSKDTTILDPEGQTVTWSAVRPDLPATVYYTRDGERMVVRKIVLSKPTVTEKETTTTTTTQKP